MRFADAVAVVHDGDLEWLTKRHGEADARPVRPWPPEQAERAFLGVYATLRNAGALL